MHLFKLSVAAIRWLALWSRPAGTTGLFTKKLLGSSGSLVAPGDVLSGALFDAVCRGLTLFLMNKESTGRGSVRLFF